ncbi:hypothetical protein Hanom_Chr12g01084491 [Helianthus anomalus]
MSCSTQSLWSNPQTVSLLGNIPSPTSNHLHPHISNENPLYLCDTKHQQTLLLILKEITSCCYQTSSLCT